MRSRLILVLRLALDHDLRFPQAVESLRVSEFIAQLAACLLLAECGHLASGSACGRFCILSAAAGTPFYLASTRFAGGVSRMNLLSGLKLLESLAEIAEDERPHGA